MGIAQTKQTEIRILTRPNRPKHGYLPVRTDRNMGMCQTEIWVLARMTSGYQTDRTGRNSGIAQSKHTKIWFSPRPSRPKYGYYPDGTDRNMGINQTEIRLLTRLNRKKYGY